MWEGEEVPKATPADMVASQVFAMLANGMGGIDWAGLPLAVAFHGVQDIEGLLRRLITIKTHRTPE